MQEMLSNNYQAVLRVKQDVKPTIMGKFMEYLCKNWLNVRLYLFYPT